MEAVFLVLLLAAPIALLMGATRLRRAREARGEYEGSAPRSYAKPWDKSMKWAQLYALTGLLLIPGGLYAFSMAKNFAFMVPVVLGVVLLSSAYRSWMRGLQELPDVLPDVKEDAGA